MIAAPDYAQPIRGWRVWVVAELEGKARLVSVYYRVPWPVRRELTAVCLARRNSLRLSSLLGRRTSQEGHATPDGRCDCGIYAADRLSTALTYLHHDYSSSYAAKAVEHSPLLHRVLGFVSLWGTVVECKAGWRGARAYPQRLFIPERSLSGEVVADLEAITFSLADYGVPIEVLDGAGRTDEIADALYHHARAA